ncbi:hypothetical protein EYZ11_003355 [Aspergillus tanneri]|uniref:Uncharacterized protein n=1 Tax=Aspergillus tanneri TaxID=1220188 RepID=A0A4S3JP25_9EURO|nr:hypothetical protein EYZ11_003355 [Aspergillus tanneri]
MQARSKTTTGDIGSSFSFI